MFENKVPITLFLLAKISPKELFSKVILEIKNYLWFSSKSPPNFLPKICTYFKVNY
jgi:hypothetical protein